MIVICSKVSYEDLVSIAIKTTFTYIGAHPGYLTFTPWCPLSGVMDGADSPYSFKHFNLDDFNTILGRKGNVTFSDICYVFWFEKHIKHYLCLEWISIIWWFQGRQHLRTKCVLIYIIIIFNVLTLLFMFNFVLTWLKLYG